MNGRLKVKLVGTAFEGLPRERIVVMEEAWQCQARWQGRHSIPTVGHGAMSDALPIRPIEVRDFERKPS